MQPPPGMPPEASMRNPCCAPERPFPANATTLSGPGKFCPPPGSISVAETLRQAPVEPWPGGFRAASLTKRILESSALSRPIRIFTVPFGRLGPPATLVAQTVNCVPVVTKTGPEKKFWILTSPALTGTGRQNPQIPASKAIIDSFREFIWFSCSNLSFWHCNSYMLAYRRLLVTTQTRSFVERFLDAQSI